MQVSNSSDFIPQLDAPEDKKTYINRYVATSGSAVLVVPKRSQNLRTEPQQLPIPDKPSTLLQDDYVDNHLRSIKSSLSCKRVLVNKMGLRAVFLNDNQGLRWWFVVSIRYEKDMKAWNDFASAVEEHVQAMFGAGLPIMYLVEDEQVHEAAKKDERLSWPSWPKRAFVDGPNVSISVPLDVEG